MITTATKTTIAVLGALILIPVLIAVLVHGALSAIFGTGTGSQPSQTALADIPTVYLTLYRTAAAQCPGLDWSILAAIGKIETDHGRSVLPGVHSGESGSGAAGPMQFLQPTFDAVIARHPLPPGGTTPPSRYDPHDAIYAAAAYLCDSGADHADLHAAIFTYNHAEWYVSQVLAQAAQYASTQGVGADTTTSAAAQQAINYAQGQLGLPYVWGGNGPRDGGFDCSGLTKAAYQAAGITLPRTADAQYHAGPPVPAGQPLRPGDLLFYGTPAHIHHVGLFIGAGQMIDAPDFGRVITIERYRHPGDDYVAATRPSARSLIP